MIVLFLSLCLLSAVLLILEKDVVRVIFYTGIFSLLSAVCFLLLAAPDVAMAEVVVSGFSTIFYIICLENYFRHEEGEAADQAGPPAERMHVVPNTSRRKKSVDGGKGMSWGAPLVFTLLLFGLFLWFIPDHEANTVLKESFLSLFPVDVGGENAVTSIYLGYRVYDTLFEALMLLVSVVAVIHLSQYKESQEADAVTHLIQRSPIAVPAIRMVAPVLLLFGFYLIINGHLSPGGGFQGGVVLSTLLLCRYMIYMIHDVPIQRFMTLEKFIFIGISVLVVLFVFLGMNDHWNLPQSVYLILMNALIGLKVACGFAVIVYRYVALERR